MFSGKCKDKHVPKVVEGGSRRSFKGTAKAPHGDETNERVPRQSG